MKYLPLIWAGLWRKPARTILTLLSVSVAFLLFGTLHGVIAGFDTGIEMLSDTRLRVQSRAGILTGLPLAHLPDIESVDGVAGLGYFAIFPSYFQVPLNPIAAGAVEMDRFFQGFPDVTISEEHQLAMKSNRMGAIIGEDLAIEHAWEIGDRVTLTSGFWAQEDGTRDWSFEIVGTYRFKGAGLPSNEFWFHYEYLDEARSRAKGTVHLYFVTIDDPLLAGRISADIDRLFINATYPTITENEKDWLRSRLDQIGNIEFFVNAIIGAVLFTLLFLTGNTMMQSVRERTPELAVLKTYGYSDVMIILLVLAEALILCVIAALLGLGMASLAFPSIFAGLGVGPIPLTLSVIVDGFAIAILLAVLSTVPPAWRAQRLNIVDALAGK